MKRFFQRTALLVAKLWIRPGDSSRRYRGIIVGGLFAGLSKLVSLVTVAISVPLTVRYLGAERYGLWMTISSLSALLSFADLGVGNGLVSALANAHGQRATDEMTRLISSAFVMLLGLGSLVAVMFLAAFPFVSWGRAFGATTPQAVSEAGTSVLAFVLCFAIGLPFTLVQRTQLALQESWRANLWQAGASIVSLMAVVIAAEQRASVAWLVLAMNASAALVSAINAFVEFGFRRPDLLPKWRGYDAQTVRRLLGSGGMFLVLQLCVVIGTASDPIVLAHIFGAAAVGPYSVTYKLFQTSLIFGLFMAPLWPALGEALGKGDFAWARLALRRATMLSVALGVILALGLSLFGQRLIHFWVGGQITPDSSMVNSFAVCIVLVAYGSPLTSLLNNAEFLGLQLKIYTLSSVASLALKFPMAYWLGPSGVVWAIAVTYSMLYCLPARVAVVRYFGRRE